MRNICITIIYVLCLGWVASSSTGMGSGSRLSALGFSVGGLVVRNICIKMIYVLRMRYVALFFTGSGSGSGSDSDSGSRRTTLGFSVGAC